jgi:catabolite regulation protein CreA
MLALMLTGPKGQNRRAEVIGNAVRVMRIATGEETEALPGCDIRGVTLYVMA